MKLTQINCYNDRMHQYTRQGLKKIFLLVFKYKQGFIPIEHLYIKADFRELTDYNILIILDL